MKVFVYVKSWSKLSCIVLALLMISTLTGICSAQYTQSIGVGGTGKVPDGIAVPILMYHSILKDPKRQGKFVVSPQVFEDDLLYLKEQGYTTVLVKDLIAYVYHDVPLPPKPVVITLDDAYYNNLTYVVPLLEKHQMKAVISVVGIFTDRFSETDDHNPNYSHLTWDDLEEIGKRDNIEIASHTYNLHSNSSRKGCTIKKGESHSAYERMLREDLTKLQDAIKERTTIPPPLTFTYPYGYICDASHQVIQDLGFKATLSCFERVNYISKDPSCLYTLGRFNRPSGISSKDFIDKIMSS